MWSIPGEITSTICDFARSLSCNYIQAVRVDYEPAYDYNNCHNNVKLHCNLYGGEPVIGWYFVEGFGTMQAIRHTVWKRSNKLIDITPFKDNRSFNLFATSKNQIEDYSIPNCYLHSVDTYLKLDNQVVYYVYQLIDPRTDLAFYIGKGTGKRANTDILDAIETQNGYTKHRIASIRADGFEPKIEYIAENIIDENLAHNIKNTIIEFVKIL